MLWPTSYNADKQQIPLLARPSPRWLESTRVSNTIWTWSRLPTTWMVRGRERECNRPCLGGLCWNRGVYESRLPACFASPCPGTLAWWWTWPGSHRLLKSCEVLSQTKRKKRHDSGTPDLLRPQLCLFFDIPRVNCIFNAAFPHLRFRVHQIMELSSLPCLPSRGSEQAHKSGWTVWCHGVKVPVYHYQQGVNLNITEPLILCMTIYNYYSNSQLR